MQDACPVIMYGLSDFLGFWLHTTKKCQYLAAADVIWKDFLCCFPWNLLSFSYNFWSFLLWCFWLSGCLCTVLTCRRAQTRTKTSQTFKKWLTHAWYTLKGYHWHMRWAWTGHHTWDKPFSNAHNVHIRQRHKLVLCSWVVVELCLDQLSGIFDHLVKSQNCTQEIRDEQQMIEHGSQLANTIQEKEDHKTH